MMQRLEKFAIITQKQATTVAFPGDTTITVTFPTPAAIQEGDMMIIVFGGTQTVTITTVPSGWTLALSAAARTGKIYYKVAEAGETGSYTFNFSGTLGGHYRGLVLENVQTYAPSIGKFNSSHSYTTVGVGTPELAHPAFDINEPCIVIVMTIPSVSTTPFDMSGGYLPASAGQSGAFKVTQKIYTQPTLAETIMTTAAAGNWAGYWLSFKALQLN